MTEPRRPVRLLVADDEPQVLEICTRVAERLGYECATAEDGNKAARLVDGSRFDIVLTDVRMPGCDGFELFRYIRAHSPGSAVVMMTGYGTIEQAVAALKSGVTDYITKPFEATQLGELLAQLAEWYGQSLLSRQGRRADPDGEPFHGIVGQSEAMQNVFDRIMRSASVDSTVLIQGESGTGKELVARAIHACSLRSGSLFLPLDCGSVSESLAESELFGHVKGAFTGSHESNSGILRAAKHGSVFLDEIGELPAPVQVKFLRALQEREVRPVGGVRPKPFDARVIAATNRDLEQDVVSGAFRKDLFYRLHVIPIHVPPLRERREDIPLLVEAFLTRHSKGGAPPIEMSQAAMDLLKRHDWPGNVRELENCIERACALGSGSTITPPDLPAALLATAKSAEEDVGTGAGIRPLASYEKEAVQQALLKTDYNKTQAARALGISVPTLYAKIRKYSLSRHASD